MSSGGVLEGRAALVTGASHGLGFEIARSFLAEGASVFLCARDASALDDAAQRLAEAGRDPARVGVQPTDVSNRAEVDALVEAATDRFPELSILVNNAGVYGPKGQIDALDWDEWVRAIEINLFGSVLLARAASRGCSRPVAAR